MFKLLVPIVRGRPSEGRFNLEAIEVALPVPQDKEPKKHYLSVVIKRGDQQREETDPKMPYVPLDPKNAGHVLNNGLEYRKVFKSLGIDQGGFKAERSSALGLSTYS